MFVPDKLREKNKEKYEGEWKVCRRCKFEVKMRPTTYKDFQNRIQTLESIERKRIGLVGRRIDQKLPTGSTEKIISEAIAREILLDWRDIFDKSGEPVPFSSDIAYAFLMDEFLPDFRSDVLDLIQAEADEDLMEVEAIEGN